MRALPELYAVHIQVFTTTKNRRMGQTLPWVLALTLSCSVINLKGCSPSIHGDLLSWLFPHHAPHPSLSEKAHATISNPHSDYLCAPQSPYFANESSLTHRRSASSKVHTACARTVLLRAASRASRRGWALHQSWKHLPFNGSCPRVGPPRVQSGLRGRNIQFLERRDTDDLAPWQGPGRF